MTAYFFRLIFGPSSPPHCNDRLLPSHEQYLGVSLDPPPITP